MVLSTIHEFLYKSSHLYFQALRCMTEVNLEAVVKILGILSMNQGWNKVDKVWVSHLGESRTNFHTNCWWKDLITDQQITPINQDF